MELIPLLLSLKLAAVTTALLLIIAPPAVYVLVFKKPPGITFVEAFIALPMVLPPSVMGFYLLMIMGPDGAAGKFWMRLTGSGLLFTFTGLVMASVICSLPFAVAPLKTAFSRIDIRMLENARVLGLSEFMVFMRVVIPNSKSGLTSASILIFLHALGEFGVILMIGGSIPGQTRLASIAIYEAVEALRYGDAMILSAALLPLSYVFLIIANNLGSGRYYES